jgi:hypothetical protein
MDVGRAGVVVQRLACGRSRYRTLQRTFHSRSWPGFCIDCGRLPMVCRPIASFKTGAVCNYNFLRRSRISARLRSAAIAPSALTLEDGYTRCFSSRNSTNHSIIRPNSPQFRCSKLGRVIPALLCYRFFLQTQRISNEIRNQGRNLCTCRLNQGPSEILSNGCCL